MSCFNSKLIEIVYFENDHFWEIYWQKMSILTENDAILKRFRRFLSD